MRPSKFFRPAILDEIKKEHLNWDMNGYICQKDLNYFRNKHIQSLLEDEKGDFGKLEQEVIEALKHEEILSADLNTKFDLKMEFDEKISDRVASFGGSWAFILLFGLV